MQTPVSSTPHCERDANELLLILGVVFCRVYINRQSAFAHHHIFREIERIVEADTGQSLRWRHIHANSLDEFDGMILHWTVDQHGGQAKGTDLHS